MANVVVNTASIVSHWSAECIAQAELLEVFRPLIGKTSDKNAFIYVPPERYAEGLTCVVPLRKAVTTAALEDGADYEGQGQKSLMSETTITKNERGQVFGGFTTYEEGQTAVDIREEHCDEAANWWAQDFDGKFISQMALATASLPTKGNRAASQYNVEYAGDAQSWLQLGPNHKATPQGITRAKKFFQQRGIRPGRIGAGYMGYILIVPSEVTYDLQWNPEMRTALKDALPPSEDHVFFKGHGLKPWGYIDGVYIVEDTRPVYGGSDYTFLSTETIAESDMIKAECIFMGAQGMAYYDWKDITWFERIYQHNRKYEMSVHGEWGASKTVIDLSATINGGTDRDYGIGYFCVAASQVS